MKSLITIVLFLCLIPRIVGAATFFDKECYYKDGWLQYCEFIDMNEKVEKYCSGKNANENKCAKYCIRVNQTHPLCNPSTAQNKKATKANLSTKKDPQFVVTESNVIENAEVGTEVLGVEFVDANLFKGSKFSLGNGNEDDLFEISANSGIISVKNSQGLDFETKNQYDIEVIVEDIISGISYPVPVVIKVVDEKEDWKCRIDVDGKITTVSHDAFSFETDLEISHEKESENLIVKHEEDSLVLDICEKSIPQIGFEPSALRKQVTLRHKNGQFLFNIKTITKERFLFFFSRRVTHLTEIVLENNKE